jgi:S-methylmethionine-dependent homocysteine/selenocysteine methylase
MGATIIGGCCEISPKYILNLYENLIDNNYKITNSFKGV